MNQFKLIYFNLRGRGELARLIFVYKGQTFEDFRLKFNDWPNIKPTIPNGTLPVLEIKNSNNETIMQLCQSRAICRYLANKFDLAGKTDFEMAKADEIVDQINDEIDMFSRANLEKNQDIKFKELERLFSFVVSGNLKYFENILSTNQNGYLVGNSLTWAE
jgi:glutathione S-transferase